MNAARIQFVSDIEDTPATVEAARALHQVRSGGTVVCEVEPGRRGRYAVAQCVLRGLGKSGERTGVQRNATTAWWRTLAWLIGEEVAELVVLRAQLLDGSQLAQFADLVADSGVRLWLVNGGCETTRSQRALGTRLLVGSTTVAGFLAALRPDDASGEPELPTSERFPGVPDDDFVLFRARCRALLSAADFATVDRVFLEALRQARVFWAASTVDEAAVATFLERMNLTDQSLDRSLTRVHAFQVAAFERDVLLRVDRDRFAARYGGATAIDLTSEMVQELRAYASPRHAAAGLISIRSGAEPKRLSQLQLADVAADGLRITGPLDATIPFQAAGIVRAHLAYRRFSGADDSQPLFPSAGDKEALIPQGRPMDPTRMAAMLRRVGADVGVTLVGNWTRHADTTARNWLQRRGISVQPLGTCR